MGNALGLDHVLHWVRPLLLGDRWLCLYWLSLGRCLTSGGPPHDFIDVLLLVEYIKRRISYIKLSRVLITDGNIASLLFVT